MRPCHGPCPEAVQSGLRDRGGWLALRPGPAPVAWQASLPQDAAGRWCRLVVGVAGCERWWVKLEATDTARGQVVREAFLGPVRRRDGLGWRETLVHLPQRSETLVLRFFAEGALPESPVARLQVLRRPMAALALLRGGWRGLPRALRGHPAGLAGRMRARLGQAPARAGEAPGYDVWCRLYDRWGAAERMALAGATLDVEAVVVGAHGRGREVTMMSLRRQWFAPPEITLVDRPGDWTGSGARWVILLQAGEVLADHAIACFARAVERTPSAAGFYADADSVGGHGRCDPLFKPGGGPFLLRTGLLTRGACLLRADRVKAVAPGAFGDCAAWRQAVALALPDGALHAIPLVLTHGSPPGDVAATVAGRGGTRAQQSVSVIIPTAGRAPHVLRCLRRMVAGTRYDGGVEYLLAVSHIVPGDRAQSRTLRRAARLPGVRVLDLSLQSFNYAAANNRAVAHARGELLLLANDDVAPLHPDWLRRMAAFLDASAGPAADIVGARLIYGDGSVQHGGVVMGLANLCEHAFRLAELDDPGPHGIANLDREVSAVTAACMLLRRSLYATTGGMDERFAVALNDVDLCLRARRQGASVVLAASVVLHHYESLSLGRHYGGARAALEAAEVRLLRERWPDAIAADPFYNLSASLEPGREFQPAFPPRSDPARWLGDDAVHRPKD